VRKFFEEKWGKMGGGKWEKGKGKREKGRKNKKEIDEDNR